MKKILKQILILFCLIAFLVLPYFVFAEEVAKPQGPTMKDILEDVGGAGGYNVAGTDQYTVSRTVGTVVNAFLSLLGVIFVGLMIYGGFTWMMARGNEEEVKRSLDIIKMAITGLVIMLGSYAIWNIIWYSGLFT